MLVRIKGQAPIEATVYELEKLRCNLCGEVFTAEAPQGVGEEKYDETAASMIALPRYGSGFPWTRLEGLEESLGIPLPGPEGAPFTSGIVSTDEGRRIALFFTGRKHAGENLGEVLKQRAAGPEGAPRPPIQMCDALSRNLPKLPEKLEIIVGHCLAHARRRFVEVTTNFPEPCRHVLESLGEVYGHDAQARGLSPEERLGFHQDHSGPVMEKLHAWLNAQFDERQVEPNSGLGTAISYLLKHWNRLTLFLRQPGAPLDNNICERALKKAILHRKNSLFYKTENGARVGDLYMSLIHTVELCGANPFDYLTELQRHAGELARAPSEWMPWNCREMLERAGSGVDSG